MATSPILSIPCGAGSDAPNGPALMLAAMTAAEKLMVMSFATSAARDSAISSPVSGMMAWLSTPTQLTMYDGTGWMVMWEPPTSYTPSTWTGITLGNGTLTGSYSRSGGRCWMKQVFTLGSTSAVNYGGSVAITLPFAGTVVDGELGGLLYDASGARAPAHNVSTTLKMLTTSGSWGTSSDIWSDRPWTWATGDTMTVVGSYAMTSRYS